MINSCFCVSLALVFILTAWIWLPLLVLTSPAWGLGIITIYLILKFFGFWGRVLWVQYEVYEWLMFRSNKPRRYLWRKFYNFLVWMVPTDEIQLMNMGFGSYTESGKTLNLPSELQSEQFSYQLYDFLFNSFGNCGKGKILLDLGCGRGAGLKYLHKTYACSKSFGVDFSCSNIAFCKKYNQTQNMQFLCADCEKLPIDDQSVDIVVCVESAHCFGNMRAVASEVKRVLKEGGCLLLADFVGQLDLEEFEENFSEFKKADRKDISENVLTSMKIDSERRATIIEKRSPFLLQRLMKRVWGTDGSSLFNQLEAGDSVYIVYKLMKE